MTDINAKSVFDRVAAEVPEDVRENIIVVGSVAAAFHFFRDDEGREFRTKDVDCLLDPRERGLEAGREAAHRLLSIGWEHRVAEGRGMPRPTPEPRDDLSVIRLERPDSDYFIEFLIVPAEGDDPVRDYVAVELDDGWFALATFKFLALAAYQPMVSSVGLRYARPSMMALANLLAHPKIGPERMSAPIEGRYIKRSNKDLGRVLSLAWLTGSDEDALLAWSAEWIDALHRCFPAESRDLAANVGSGLRELFESEEDFEEAHHTCVCGLLVAKPPTVEQLRAVGQRFLQDVIEPAEASAK